jgi:hypothetical protein
MLIESIHNVMTPFKLTLTFGKWDGIWNGLIWLRTGTSGEILLNAVLNHRIPYDTGSFFD